MEDDYTKYILYAVIAVLYILFKVFRKKKPATTNGSPLPNSQPVEPSYPDRSTEDEEESYASPTETDDKPSTFKGSMGELLKEFLEGPKQGEFDPEPLDREDELREEIPDSGYQDEELEPEETEIIADPPQKTYERAGETSPPLTPSPSESEKRGIGETEKRGRPQLDKEEIQRGKQVTDSPIHPFTDSVSNSSGGNLGGAATLITAVADCTGHGVPGAFMSILGVGLLNEIVVSKKIVKANEILDELRALIIESLHQTGKEGEAQEGMDIALCVINTTMHNGIPSAKSLQFAGAFNSLYLIRDGQLLETKADRMTVGVHFKQNKSFTNHHIKILPGDIIYTYSDGYADQLGGSENQKFMSYRFKKLLLSIHKKPLKQQKQILNTTINEWKAYTDPITGRNYEQTDDILVMGMRF